MTDGYSGSVPERNEFTFSILIFYGFVNRNHHLRTHRPLARVSPVKAMYFRFFTVLNACIDFSVPLFVS